MRKITLIMGLIALLKLLGCNQKSTNETLQADTSTVVSINPNELLFTIATLNNSLPDFKEKTEVCAFFHEDEWRQVEFISKSQKSAIEKEIAKIKDIYDNHAHKTETYMAFKSVAVRDLITEPLAVEFSTLTSYLTDKEFKIQGLGLENNPGQVNGGFFFALDGVSYYGLLDNGVVKTFCIYSADSDEDLKSATGKLSDFLQQENLYLVDWRSMHVFDETSIKTELVIK